jgi:hypothetical protein
MWITKIATACGLFFFAGLEIANATCPSLPYNLTNGTTADATQVMANFNSLLNCLNCQPNVFPPNGRLTLSSQTPVMTSSVSAAGTIYYTPYVGNLTPIWTGSGFSVAAFPELTNVLANSSTGNAGPAAAIASSVYDLFVWSNAGTITLTRGPAWTSLTVRSAGTALSRVNGVLTNAVAITNGPAAQSGTYVGTIMTDAAGATVSYNLGSAAARGGAASLGVWNAYNQVETSAFVSDTTGNWLYASSTVRMANNSAGNRVSFVLGLNEDAVDAISSQVIALGGSAAFYDVGWGLDTTSAWAARSRMPAAQYMTTTGSRSIYPGIGGHFIQMLEAGDNTNQAATYGNDPSQTYLNVSLRN